MQIVRIYFKILIHDVGYLGLVTASPFLFYIFLQLHALPGEIYGYSISLILAILTPIFAMILHNFNAAKVFKLHFRPELSQAIRLLPLNLLSTTPLLVPTLFAVKSPELSILVLTSIAAVSFVLIYRDRKSVTVALLPLSLLPLQRYGISVLYALLPLLVLLITWTTSRARVLGGITLFPHHVLFSTASVFATALPLLVHSKKVYLTSSGMGMIDPDFLHPLLVIDAMVFQILLILLPFTLLVFARSIDVRVDELRIAVGTPLKRKITAVFSTFALSLIIILSVSVLLSGILQTDLITLTHLSLAAAFACLIVPADPDRSSRSLLSLVLYLIIVFGLSFPATALLLPILLYLYDLDVKIARWLNELLS